MNPAPPDSATRSRPVRWLACVLAGIAILTYPYIDLSVAIPIASWHMNAPVGDIAVSLLIAVVAADALLTRRAPLPLPGWIGYAVLVVAGMLALPAAIDAHASLHTLVRKVIFSWIAYGGAIALVVARVLPDVWLRRLVRASLTTVALLSLATSLGRILAGNTLWFSAIEGLTNNHKTLAVAMAPVAVLAWSWRGRLDRGVAALAFVAIALSLSRTAWIASAVGICFFVVVRGRPLANRHGVLPAVVVFGFLVATYGPILSGSVTQFDALRSRHSLDRRAWEMFAAHPIVGMGAGSGVLVVQETFPDYRVNGVETHGVVQKVGSEHGLVGLLGYALFFGAMARRVRSHHHDGNGVWPTFLALHANLLLSTEAFTLTHWLPLGLVWGLAHRDVPPDGNRPP